MTQATTALSATTLTGDKVRNRDGEKLGHLEEIVIDIDTGRVSYAVLASGGFLGLGDKYFAVPWDLLTIDTENHEVVIDVAKEALENAPGFDKENWPDINDKSWVVDVYRYYGSDPYWEEDDPTVEKTTDQPTAEETTDQPMAEETTDQPTVEETTDQPTVEETTDQPEETKV